MAVERLFDSANSVIMLDVNRPLAVCRPDSPGPHQGMLQDREVVACVHALIEQAVLQAWGNARTGETDRAGNDFSTLLAGQTWHQVLAAVHGFGQAVERVAFAEKIRTHGHTDID